jgi:hypothetical protein
VAKEESGRVEEKHTIKNRWEGVAVEVGKEDGRRNLMGQSLRRTAVPRE